MALPPSCTFHLCTKPNNGLLWIPSTDQDNMLYMLLSLPVASLLSSRLRLLSLFIRPHPYSCKVCFAISHHVAFTLFSSGDILLSWSQLDHLHFCIVAISPQSLSHFVIILMLLRHYFPFQVKCWKTILYFPIDLYH